MFLSTLLTGCVVIPTPEHGLVSGRGEITKTDMAALEVGLTTREEVLLKFGEPTASFDDGRILDYDWCVVAGYWAWAIPVGPYTTVGDTDNVSRDYRVRIEFNEQGRLKRCVRNHIGWFGTTPEPIDVWHTPETPAPISTEAPGTTRGHEAPERIVIDPTFDSRPLESVPLAAIPSTRVRIWGVVDARTTGPTQRIGLRTGNFAEVRHEIYLARPVDGLVQGALVAQWQAAGHPVVDSNEDIGVSARVNEFKIETPLSFWSWSAVGTVDLVVELRDHRVSPRSLTRRYQSKSVRKTLVGPSQKEFESVINTCLRDVMRQMISDAEVAGFLAEETGRRGAEETGGLSEADNRTVLPLLGAPNERCNNSN